MKLSNPQYRFQAFLIDKINFKTIKTIILINFSMYHKFTFYIFLFIGLNLLSACKILPGSAMIPYICFDKNGSKYKVSGWTFDENLDNMKFTKHTQLGGCNFGTQNGVKFWASTAPFLGQENRKNGETFAFKFSQILFEKVTKVDNSLVQMLNNDVNARMKQEKDFYEKKPSRFKDIKINVNKLYATNYGFCQTYQLELKDYEAPNKPSDIEFLIQKDFNKFCYHVFGNFEFIMLSMSHRSKENNIMTFEDLNNQIKRFEEATTFQDKNMKEPKPMSWYNKESK